MPVYVFASLHLLDRSVYLFSAFDHVLTNFGTIKTDTQRLQHTKKEISDYDGSIRENFEQLVTDHSESMYRFLMYRFNLKKHACDDIFQECLYRIYEKAHLYDTSKSLGPWIMTIVYRTALDFLTKHTSSQDKYRDVSEIESFLDQMKQYTEEPSGELEKTYKEGLIRYMLSTLTEQNKTLIVLYYFEDKSYHEIAEIVGCKASSVGTLLSRAKEELTIKIQSNEYLCDAIIL